MKKDLPHSQITYLESDINYTVVHYEDGSSEVHSYTLKIFEEKLLDTAAFKRIHRSYLVNENFITKKTRRSVSMPNGIELPISRRRR